MEWIYTQTKMSDQGSVELALIMKKKERRQMAIFLNFRILLGGGGGGGQVERISTVCA